MTTPGKDLRQLTKHKGWDVKRPSIDAGRIVYQLGADIRHLRHLLKEKPVADPKAPPYPDKSFKY